MIIAVAAVGEDNVIAIDGKIPWYCPQDLRFFRALTLNRVVVMGRKTFDTFGGRTLRNRTNVVLTKNPPVFSNGVRPYVCQDADEALKLLKDDKRGFVIGGGEIYKQFLDDCNLLVLTRFRFYIAADGQKNDFFPQFSGFRRLTFVEIRENYPFIWQAFTESFSALSVGGGLENSFEIEVWEREE